MRRPHRAALPVPLLTAALLLTGCGGVSRRQYVSRNEALLKSLPLFPGAVEAHSFSTPHYGGGEGSSPDGYTTTVVYRVVRGTRSGPVLRFYRARLARRGWHPGLPGLSVATRRQMSRTPLAYFSRDRALVVVNAVTLRPVRDRHAERTYMVVADYRGADD